MSGPLQGGIDHRIGDAVGQVQQAPLQKKDADRAQQIKLFESQLKKAGITDRELREIATALTGKPVTSPNGVKELYEFLLQHSYVETSGGKKPVGQELFARAASKPKFLGLIKGYLQKLKSDPTAPRLIKFGFVFKAGQDDKIRLYGFDYSTAGKTGKITGQKFQALLQGTMEPNDMKSLVDIFGEDGVAQLMQALLEIGNDPEIGFQPPQNGSPVNAEGQVGPSETNPNLKIDFINIKDLEAMAIIKQGLQDISDAMSDFVQFEMNEDARIQKEGEKAQLEKQQQTQKDKKLIQKKVEDKINDLKAKIAQYIKEGNKGALLSIQAQIADFVKYIDGMALIHSDNKGITDELNAVKEEIKKTADEVDEALKPDKKEEETKPKK